MTDLRSWLVPTLAGPFVTLWGLTILALVLIGQGAASILVSVLGFDADTWAMALLLSGAFASGLFVWLAIADVVLLSRKRRRLPTGWGAFKSAAATPFAFYAVTMIPVPLTSVLMGVLWAVTAMGLAAFATRWLMGRAIE